MAIVSLGPRLIWAVLLAVTLAAASCGPAVPVPNASASLAVSVRIATLGRGQDWYAALKLVDSRPEVEWNGPNLGPVYVWLASGIDPGSAIASRACQAILEGLTTTHDGPALNVDTVIVQNPPAQHECWTG